MIYGLRQTLHVRDQPPADAQPSGRSTNNKESVPMGENSLDELRKRLDRHYLVAALDPDDNDLMVTLEKVSKIGIVRVGDLRDKDLSSIFAGLDVTGSEVDHFVGALDHLNLNLR